MEEWRNICSVCGRRRTFDTVISVIRLPKWLPDYIDNDAVELPKWRSG